MSKINLEKREVTINEAQRLYVIPCGDGFTCLGFDVCEARRFRLARELASLGYTPPIATKVGSLEDYKVYEATQAMARDHNKRTGRRFTCELHPQLIGLEGKRVEVAYGDGSVERFWVGVSTGWTPIHLRVHNTRSRGGGAIECDRKFVTVKVVRER